MRNTLSDALVRLATEDDRVVLLTGDHGYALFDAFRAARPDQYINAGVAEQNMVGMAAGLARTGFRPIVYGLSAFVPVRVLEQIKLDCCYTPLPVTFLGDGAGMVYSTLGSSHQSTEDIAITRVLPHLTVLSPADRWELDRCIEWSRELDGPTYLRIGKSDQPEVHGDDGRARLDAVTLGELVPVIEHSNPDVVIIATGSMVANAHAALAITDDIRANLWSAPSLKPLDARHLVEVVGDASTVVTVEEHNHLGGLGSIVAELLSEHQPTRVERLGIDDAFATKAGSWSYLMQSHGLSSEHIARRLREFATVAT